MPTYFYAQVNDDDIVVGESAFAQEIDEPHMIPIAQADGTYLRKRHEGGGIFVEVAPAPVPPPPWAWLIDPGSFRDRFGAAKMAVLTSADPGVKALLSDMQGRSWIDLQSPDVVAGLVYIGTVVPEVDAALRGEIITTPVTEFENMVLRKLYFS